VPAEQTYLDIGQGNRVFDSLYDEKLPVMSRRGCTPAWWRAVEERAASAPADIVPGLLTATLEDAGIGVRAGGGASCTFSSRGPREASAAPPKKLSGTPRPHAANTFEVRASSLRQLPSLVRRLHGNDLLIAIERPPPGKNEALAIGIAGRGFDGNLTSDSTRTDGYVLSTDIAPTVLTRLGPAVPPAMSGQPIRAQGSVEVAAIESLGARMAAISGRRGPVIGVSLLVWLLVLALSVLVTAGRAARADVRLVGLSVIYLPLVLLIGAALEPSQGIEQLLVMAVAPAFAAITLAAHSGYRALAVASGLVAFVYAADAIAGSPLTALSLLGPSPGLGARFYGIGNELEALLGVLVVAGTGAALQGFAPRLPVRAAATAFLASGLLFALVFAAGRFGADVGAAIVLPIGAAVAASKVAIPRRRAALFIIAAPLAVVGLIVLVDLFSGANAHLTRSVLDAGGLGDLAEVAQRRLQLSAHSFLRPVVLLFGPLVLALAVLAVRRRDRLHSWLSRAPAMEAGLLGALAATVAGTLANDSGALVLEIGTAYLLVFAGFAWAEGAPEPDPRPSWLERLKQAAAPPEKRPPIAGRESEQAEFDRLLFQEEIAENLVFTGRQGVGKTAFLKSLEPRAKEQGWHWLPADLSERASTDEAALVDGLVANLATITGVILTSPRVRRHPMGYAVVREPQQAPIPREALASIYEKAEGPVSARIEAVLEATWEHVRGHDENRVAFAFDEVQNLSERRREEGFSLEALLDAFHSVQGRGIPFMLVLVGSPTLFPRLVHTRAYAKQMFREVTLGELRASGSR
jgi:hypothetical protein